MPTNSDLQVAADYLENNMNDKPTEPGWYLFNFGVLKEAAYWDGKQLCPYEAPPDFQLPSDSCWSGSELKAFTNFRRLIEAPPPKRTDYVKVMSELREISKGAWDNHHLCPNCRSPVKDGPTGKEYCDEDCKAEHRADLEASIRDLQQMLAEASPATAVGTEGK